MNREIMRQAVFALAELIYDFPDGGDVDSLANAKTVMKSLEAELAKPEQSKYSDIVSNGGLDPRNKFDAQPEQEPVRWFQQFGDAPPKREWVGLTDDDIENLWNGVQWSISDFVIPFTRAVEAKLKERNCG